MNKKFKLSLMALLLLVCVSIGGCKPRYKAPGSDPMASTSPDAPQVLDFEQIHNEMLELYSDNPNFGFIKNLDISGSNDKPKSIKITMECIEDCSDEAIDGFMSMLIQNISNEAVVQDNRYTRPDMESFGSVYESYALEYNIKRGEELYSEITIEAGEEIPFEPGITLYFDED